MSRGRSRHHKPTWMCRDGPCRRRLPHAMFRRSDQSERTHDGRICINCRNKNLLYRAEDTDDLVAKAAECLSRTGTLLDFLVVSGQVTDVKRENVMAKLDRQCTAMITEMARFESLFDGSFVYTPGKLREVLEEIEKEGGEEAGSEEACDTEGGEAESQGQELTLAIRERET